MTVVMARIIFASLLIAFVLSMILNHVDAACRDQNTCDSCTGYGKSCRWCPAQELFLDLATILVHRV